MRLTKRSMMIGGKSMLAARVRAADDYVAGY